MIEAPCHEPHLLAEPWLVDELLLVAGADRPLAQRQGVGISCLSRWVVAEMLDSGRLACLDSDLPTLKRRFFILRHKDKFVSPALEAFWRVCRDFMD